MTAVIILGIIALVEAVLLIALVRRGAWHVVLTVGSGRAPSTRRRTSKPKADFTEFLLPPSWKRGDKLPDVADDRSQATVEGP